MAKPFKIFLWIIGGFIVLLVTVAIAVPLVFDPNDYRTQISTGAEEQTGRELAINGEIELSVFPWLSVQVNDVVMGNAEGFGPEPFAQVARIDAGVKLLPLLLDRQVQIGTVTVEGLQLNLAKSKDGSDNWSDIGAQEDRPEPAEPAEPGGEPFAFSIGGVKIKHASLSYTDRQAGATQKLDKLNFETGPVAPGEPLDIMLSFLASSSQPEIAAEVKLTAQALADLEQKKYEAKDLKLVVSASGAGVPGGKQELAMRGNARYDQPTGALTLPDLVIEAAGVVLTAAISGENLAGDAPRLSGKLSTNRFSPREVTRKLAIALPSTADESALSQASFAADYSGNFSSARLDNLALQLDQSTATGFVHVTDFATQAIQFALKLDAFDADRYLAPAADGADQPKEGGGDFRQAELPANALDAVNARGTVELGSLKLKGVNLSDVKLTLDAPKGKVKTQELTAQLYGGKIQQSARITPGPKPQYDIKTGLLSINAGPLLLDLTGKSWLSGAGNFNLALTTGGATVGDALKALDGSLSTNLLDGALEGFNLKQAIARAKALSRGEPQPAGDAPARTPFSDLAASATIDNGVLTTKALSAKGDDYTLTGDGNVNLVAQEINYVLRPSYTAGSEKGITVPVSITGSLTDPKVRVDFKGLVKEQVTHEIEEKKEELKQKAGEKLQDFLRKKLPPPKPAEPEPQPPASTPAEPPPAQSPPPEQQAPPPSP